MKIGANSLLSSLSSLAGISSGPEALFVFKCARSLFIPLSSTFIFPMSSIAFKFIEMSVLHGAEKDYAKYVLMILVLVALSL